jgi:hypothetical protein
MKCQKCDYDNDENALYCGLCYEPLKKNAKTELQEPASGPAQAETIKAAVGPLLRIALIAGILSGAGVYFYGTSDSGGRAPAALEAVRLQENTQEAEKLLAAHSQAREELLKEIEKGKIDPKGFGLDGQYTKKLFKLEEDYANGINTLQLACPKCAKDAVYIKWSEDYRARETAAMKDFNNKYQLLIRKAGAD